MWKPQLSGILPGEFIATRSWPLANKPPDFGGGTDQLAEAARLGSRA